MSPCRNPTPYDFEHVAAKIRPPEGRSIGEWAEASIVLDARSSAEPGLLKLSRTPYIRGILDAFQDWKTREITLVAGTQIGKTLTELVCLGWAVDQKPAPIMLVLPTEGLARRFSKTRIKPIFDSSKVLDSHRPAEAWSESILEYHFDRMSLLLAWANSPATLASQPICYLLLDEVDKYPPASKKEADPFKLARERVRTFYDHKIIKASTPTTPDGPIMKEWHKSSKQRYFVPCPHCGSRQTLVFPQIKWPAGERSADALRNQQSAWYECRECAERIEDGDKPAMLEAGEWVAENAEAVAHAGFHLNALYSPWLTWSDIAAEFLESKDDRTDLQNFTNSWMGEPWEDRVASVDQKSINELNRGVPKGVVPEEGQMVAVGIDWHAERKGYYWSAWAFGAGRRQWLVDYGIAYNLDDLKSAILDRDWATPSGIVFNPFVGVDSAYETPKVYDFTRELYPQFRPIKGQETIVGATIRESPVDYRDARTGKHYHGFALLNIHTNYYKDLLAIGLMETGEGEGGKVSLCQGVEESFLRALASEHKIRQRGKRTEIWVKRYAGADNHWWDTSVIASAVADRWGWQRLAPLPEPAPENVRAKPSGVANQNRTESELSPRLLMRRH